MKKWIFWVLVLVLSVGMLGCQARLMSREGFASIRAKNEDFWWAVSEEERVPRRDADQLLAADGVVYLYYEEYGYVNAYRDDGTFLRGYQVASGQNGIGGIGYADGILYINGRVSGVYAFEGENLLQFEEQSIHNPEHDVYMDIVRNFKPVTDGGYTYYYNAEAGQINRAMPGQALETVVQLPVKDFMVDALLFANLALWAAGVFGMRMTDNVKEKQM